jgi:site-specific recombinase XerD
VRLTDCVRCGAGVGFKNQQLCHRCRAADREAALRAVCPSCGEFLRLQPGTGRCVRCTRTCVDCGQVLRFKTSVRCRVCRRRAETAAAKSVCARCGRLGFIRDETGWCGSCSRRPAPPLQARPCTSCGELRRKKGDGPCLRCWTRSPTRPITQAENLLASLADPPHWLIGFAEFAAERHCIERASVLVSAVGGLLREDWAVQPQVLLERARRPGRSAGALARTLEEFFIVEGLAFGLDQDARLAHGRRQRRVNAAPVGLRPAVAAFADHLVRSNERARRAGTHPRADNTIEQTLGIVRDLARFLAAERGKQDWSTVDVADAEAFLAERPDNRRRRLQSTRQFFRWARKNKLVLVDPTRDLPAMPRRGFTGPTLSLTEQRRLFQRWTSEPGVHPHEALVGLMALLHAASNTELRDLRVDDVDRAGRTMRLGRRRHSVPLDPVTVAALNRCLDHRTSLGTRNPHVIVTKTTRTRSTTASAAYMCHVLDCAGVSPKRLRSTRIVELVVSLDPKVVSEALGMKAEGIVDYLADHVDHDRLAATTRLSLNL